MDHIHLIFFLTFLFVGMIQCGCPQGWLHYDNSCYILSQTQTDWLRAASSCREHGSTLAEIETSQEDQYLTGLAQVSGKYYWVGGRDDLIEGHWEWSSGKPFHYTNWKAGEPNEHINHYNQDCLMIRGQWLDNACDRHVNFICEREYRAPVIGK